MVMFGVSSYSLHRAVKAKEMTILDVIAWTAENGGEHVEIVPLGMKLEEDPKLVEAIVHKAAECGIDISNYAIGAQFLTPDEASYEQEIERVKRQVDVANALGVKRMRHDVASRPPAEATAARFQQDLEKLAESCGRIADYAAQYGIITSVENHGYHIQASDRVQVLIEKTGRDNFRTTLDVGNFMCADEESVAAVKKNIRYASMVHLKDFYLRPSYRNPGQGWFTTTTGNYLRGAIAGQGDIDMWEVIRSIKSSGYDGYISIEFEGLEECRFGTKAGLDNAKRIWNEV